jgi:hypothetical protein
MSTLEVRRVDEIKAWRENYNISDTNEAREMAEMIDDLISFLDTPEASVNNRVVFQVGYNSYLLSEHVRVIDVAMLVRALDGAVELDWNDKLKDDKEPPKVEIRIVPQASIMASTQAPDDSPTHIPSEEIDQLTLARHEFQPMDDDPEYCKVDGCHNLQSDDIHDLARNGSL